METKWNVAMYIDEKANEAQQGAIGQVFGGQAGGHFELMSGLMGKVLGVRTVPIEYTADGKKRSLRIPNVTDFDIEGIEGAGGEPVTISNNPFGIVPGVPPVIARTGKATFKDHGLDWDFSGTNGYYSDFSYAGP